MKFVYIVSLGCVKNLVDTELASGSLVVNGFGISNSSENADVYFINTCSFIQSARNETIEYIQDAIKWKKNKKNAKIIIAGCFINWDKNLSFKEKFPKVDAWIHSDDIKNLADVISSLFENKTTKFISPGCGIQNPQFLYNEKTPRIQLTLPHIAYLKIADGCDNQCTYCTIPSIRGQLRCRTIQSVTIEARNLINNGVKELILIAQDLGAFNQNSAPENLAELLKKLDNLQGDFMIRLLYIHPRHLSNEVIGIIASSKHILHYMDLPLQHISDKILNAMNRKITKDQIEEKINYIKKQIPDIALRTTFITGFPGETNDDFNILKNFIQKFKFSRIGFFTYFKEPGTPAASMKNQVSHKIALERMLQLSDIQHEIARNQNKNLIGSNIQAIVDSFDHNGRAMARSYMDAPEVDNTIIINNIKNIIPGISYNIKITQAESDILYGTPVT